MTRWLAVVLAAMVVMVAGAMATTDRSNPEQVPGAATVPDDRERAPDRPDDASVLTRDPATVAGARGWTAEQAQEAARRNDALATVDSAVRGGWPELYVGAVAAGPDSAPVVFVKGPAPPALVTLVRDSPHGIELRDGQPFNEAELTARGRRVALALHEGGLQAFGVSARPSDGGKVRVDVEASSRPGRAEAEVRRLLPDDLRSSVIVEESPPGSFDEE